MVVSRLCAFLTLLALPLFGIAAEPAKPNAKAPLKVLVYDHSEGEAKAPSALGRFLVPKNGFTLKKVTPAEIREGALDACDVLIMPGGSGSKQAEKLEEKGRENIQNFVRKGGGYVGICAGSYLASSDYKWSLHILNAKVLDRAHWARGTGDVTIELTEPGKSLLDPKQKDITVYYGQGPLLAPGESETLPKYETLASYTSEIAKKGAPTGVMIGTTAIARSTFGEGRVICYSPHPEVKDGPNHLIMKGVLWAGKRDGGATEATEPVEAATEPEAGKKEAAAKSAKDFKGVSVQKGTLPIVLTVPHDGVLDIPGVPPRSGEGKDRFVTVRDVRAATLARAVSKQLEQRYGARPHLIVMEASRKYVDANRAPEEGYESDAAKAVYDEFHAAVTAATADVRKAYGRGLLIDVHGQSAEKDAVFRGTDNGKSLKALTGKLSTNPGRQFCAVMEKSGLRMLPPSSAESNQEVKYSGGHIIIAHGSHTPGGLDAIQMEFGTNLRAKETIELTARETVDGLAHFCEAAELTLTAAKPKAKRALTEVGQ